ncbi:MAG: signal peptidase II [Acidimicrobiia bacterium]|nr:signal peptidase II [Acidimicrobiia bacterium]
MVSLTKHLDSRRAFRVAAVTGLVVLVIDQITKNWARDHFQDGPYSVIGDWLQVRYAENPGAAFSSFTGSGPLIGVIAIGVVVFLGYLVARTSRLIDVVALGLILGGALGNLTDRVFRGEGVLDGAVVDWIDWWFIPTFNIADAALNVGVAALLIAALFLPDHG